jgi:hypothetical protein
MLQNESSTDSRYGITTLSPFELRGSGIYVTASLQCALATTYIRYDLYTQGTTAILHRKSLEWLHQFLLPPYLMLRPIHPALAA